MILQNQSNWNGITPNQISGCVFYMNFDEVTNGSYIEDKISGRLGSINGNPLPNFTGGRFSSGLGFCGGSGTTAVATQVLFGSPLPIDRNGDISLSLWVNPGNHSGNHIDTGHFFSTNDYSFWVRKNSGITGSISVNWNITSGAASPDKGPTVKCPNNQWNHIVATKASWDNGASGLVYVDGILRGTTNFIGSMTSRVNRFQIGAHASYPQYQYLACSGLVDDIALYDRILSSNEVIQLYEAGIPKYTNIKIENNSMMIKKENSTINLTIDEILLLLKNINQNITIKEGT